MALPRGRRLPAWSLAVFALALALRLAFLFAADQPLLYTHQYTYFTNALRIAEHEAPLRYVVTSDEWRTWDNHWTIAPGYHLFAAAVFKLFGPHLLGLRLVQCVLDSLAAVGVAWLGRRLAGAPLGTWAGVAYAFYWPALEMPTWTMTENLHTPLLVAAIALLCREAERPSPRLVFLAGVVLGLSALARSVSTGLLGLAVLWRLYVSWTREREPGARRPPLRPALLLGLGGALVILPWTARNVFIVGDAVLIESAAFENIWFANRLVDHERFLKQEKIVHAQPTPAEKRKTAFFFALRGIQRSPDKFVDKVFMNFRHFFRPEGLHTLLGAQRSLEPWRLLGLLTLDDLVVLFAAVLCLPFFLGGAPSAGRTLLALWVGYYLFMVIVVFHNEIRYRSAFMPFALAGALAGLRLLADGEWRTRRRVAVGALAGLALGASMVWPYVPLAAAAASERWAVRPALFAVRGGDVAGSLPLAESAAASRPDSPFVWFPYARALHFRGAVPESIAAYRRGEKGSTYANWLAMLAMPRLLARAGDLEGARRALWRVDRASWDEDPWLILEVAWRELPPPRTDEVTLAQNDYGAVRGFLHPRGVDPKLSEHRQEWQRWDWQAGPQPPPGPHRWSRARSWIRLLPATPAAAYDVTLTMGSPFPSTLEAPVVAVRANGGEPVKFTLAREVRSYSMLRVPAVGGAPFTVQLDAPTWSRAGEPADQGVRVESLRITPSR